MRIRRHQRHHAGDERYAQTVPRGAWKMIFSHGPGVFHISSINVVIEGSLQASQRLPQLVLVERS